MQRRLGATQHYCAQRSSILAAGQDQALITNNFRSFALAIDHGSYNQNYQVGRSACDNKTKLWSCSLTWRSLESKPQEVQHYSLQLAGITGLKRSILRFSCTVCSAEGGGVKAAFPIGHLGITVTRLSLSSMKRAGVRRLPDNRRRSDNDIMLGTCRYMAAHSCTRRQR
jgi:hypothetical protein